MRRRTQSPNRSQPAHSHQNATDFGSNQERIAQINAAQSTGGQQLQPGGSEPTKLDIKRTLRLHSEGEDVKALQRFLGLTGDAVDGAFGADTKTKVVDWQKANGLSPDGIVGRGTVAAMNGIELLYGHSKRRSAMV